MADKLTRRRLLQTAGTAALIGTGLGLSRRVEASPWGTDSQPAESMARLFPGLCAYSYGKYLKSGQMTMQDFIRKAVELGSTGADMTVYWFKSTDPAYLDDLRHVAFKNGVPLSGVACGASLVQADRRKRGQALESIKEWVKVTDRLGASHLRIFAGKLPPGVTLGQSIEWVADGMKSACDYAGKKGITLGIEDHDGVTQQASVCLEIMHRVDSPYAGINLDITNFVPTPSEDAYSQIKACIPYATHTHIRDRFADGMPVDLDRVWRMFAEGRYKGFMSVEYESHKGSMTGVSKLMDKVKALCRKYSST
jgi:sugar phosphate isomerase/epimerase